MYRELHACGRQHSASDRPALPVRHPHRRYRRRPAAARPARRGPRADRRGAVAVGARRRRPGGCRHAAGTVALGRTARRSQGDRRLRLAGERRLPGLRNEYERRCASSRDEDQDSPRLAATSARSSGSCSTSRISRCRSSSSSTAGAKPRRWGEWLAAFEHLVPRVLRQPARVVRVLGEMAPLASVGPVTLREVREVLAPRLLTLTHEPPRRRHGRVFVGTPHAARGRAFRVVFVPGLAERMFPQRLREDALLLDARRRARRRALRDADDRAPTTSGCSCAWPLAPRASACTVVSAPRARRVAAARAVVLRARRHARDRPARCRATDARPSTPPPTAAPRWRGRRRRIPRTRSTTSSTTSRCCCRCCARRGTADQRGARALPARAQPGAAPLASPSVGRGGSSRGRPPTASCASSAPTAAALDAQRLAARPYSLTALQRFATCPYQFLLAAIYRLRRSRSRRRCSSSIR